MLLRRVITHFRQQEWTAIVIDFLIVGLGVFLGLQAQEWSQQREDKYRETQIVADMLADLEIDRDQYVNAMALGERRIAAANASLKSANLSPIVFDYQMPHADLVSYDWDLFKNVDAVALQNDRLWTDLVITYFPEPSTSTYDALVGAGDIKIIKDRELVRQIQIYRNLIRGVIRQNDKLTSMRTNALQVGAQFGLAPYSSTDPHAYFDLIASTPELAATIRILATFTVFHFGEIKSADIRAAQLQERLQTYLDNP